MESKFAILYTAIVERLKAEIPVQFLRYVDFDLGQMEAYNPQAGGRPAVTFPGCLIDFENFNSEEEGEFGERLEGIILLRLCFDPVTGTDALTPGTYRAKGLEYFETEHKLNKALKGWSFDDAFGYLSRVSAATEKRDDKYRVRQIRYRISFTDDSTESGEQTANVNGYNLTEI